MNLAKGHYHAGMTTWQHEMTERIGKQVRELRGNRTALWLSERTAELGMKISRSALSELESGKRRSISLAEFLILSAALEVPPAHLLYPTYPDGIAEVIPGLDEPSHSAADWIGGHRTLMFDGDQPQLEDFANEKVELTREREGLTRAVLTAWKIRGAQGDPMEGFAAIEQQRASLNARIRRAGGVVDNGEG